MQGGGASKLALEGVGEFRNRNRRVNATGRVSSLASACGLYAGCARASFHGGSTIRAARRGRGGFVACKYIAALHLFAR